MRHLLLLLILPFALSCNSQEKPVTDLASAAVSLTKDEVTYDGRYFSIDYPNGDVPADKGVCTDVIIRAYRKLGIDLQQLVHEDMKANFSKYPKNWGLSKPDPNIDHRRVPNLRRFFKRKGASLPVTSIATDYKAGDIVTWDIGNGLVHIGIVINEKSLGGTPLIVHNMGAGQVKENWLFRFKITGRYRFKSDSNDG
jgi:uncharacterized protein